MTKFLFDACLARLGSGLLLVTTDACCTVVPFVGKKPQVSSHFLLGPRVSRRSARASCWRMRLQGGLLVRVPLDRSSRMAAGINMATLFIRALAKLVAEAVSDGGAIGREETIDF